MCHILTTGKQCKTSNHSSARKLEPVQKDPVLSMFNCCWWLLVSHAWQCVCHAASCLCSFLSAFTPGDGYSFSDQGRERERGRKKKPSQTQSNMYPNNPSHWKGVPKNGQQRPAFINLSTPPCLCLKQNKTKEKATNKKTLPTTKNESVASATDSIPTGKSQVSCLLDYMFEHMLGAAWSSLNYSQVAMIIIFFGELELYKPPTWANKREVGGNVGEVT